MFLFGVLLLNEIYEFDIGFLFSQFEVVCATSGNSASSMVPIATRKKGIKWTKDLHELFVAAVNCLGGAQSKLSSNF